jgi:hypothetical protein
MCWKDYFTRETGKLADTVKDLLSALEAVEVIKYNRYISVTPYRPQPVFQFHKIRETLEKLEDYLNIEMAEEPAKKFYRQRKKKEDK